MTESVNAAHKSAEKIFSIYNFILLIEYSLTGPLMTEQLESVRLGL